MVIESRNVGDDKQSKKKEPVYEYIYIHFNDREKKKLGFYMMNAVRAY